MELVTSKIVAEKLTEYLQLELELEDLVDLAEEHQKLIKEKWY